MNSPSQKTIKRLFAVSRNRCAFPGCKIPLVEDSGTVTGEIAHIKSVSENGSRFDPKQTDEERHSFDNLILLCGRHHRVVDVEVEKYSVKFLLKMKYEHESREVPVINPKIKPVVDALLQQYENLVVAESGSKVAIHSPGAIQTDVVNIKPSRAQVKILPPNGSIGNDPYMSSYIAYLIKRYQEYQKSEQEKGRYKYIAIFKAIEREFGSRWQLLPEDKFPDLTPFLCKRIDNTRIGRIRKKRGQRNYHYYEEHGK